MENKTFSSIILNEKESILNLLNTEDYQTNKGKSWLLIFCFNWKKKINYLKNYLDKKIEKIEVDKLQTLYSMEYIDAYLKEVNKIPKWLVPDDKETKRKIFRQSNEFSKLDESLKIDKTDLSLECIRNLKMLVLNAEFLDTSKIDVNKINQAGLNVKRFIDKFELDSQVNCDADSEQVKDLASKCSNSAKVYC